MSETLFLDQVPKGWAGIVGEVDPTSASAARLGTLGFLPGRALSLSRVAPMGDPIEVKIAGQRIGLRRADARAIRVQSERES